MGCEGQKMQVTLRLTCSVLCLESRRTAVLANVDDGDRLGEERRERDGVAQDLPAAFERAAVERRKAPLLRRRHCH